MLRVRPLLLPLVAIGAAALVGLASGEPSAPGARRPSAAEAKFATVPLTPEARAVMDVRIESRREIDALVHTLAATKDAVAQRELQKQISRAKLGAEVRILRLRSQQAIARGDLASAQELEALANAIEHPKAPDASAAQSIDKRITPERRQP